MQTRAFEWSQRIQPVHPVVQPVEGRRWFGALNVIDPAEPDLPMPGALADLLPLTAPSDPATVPWWGKGLLARFETPFLPRFGEAALTVRLRKLVAGVSNLQPKTHTAHGYLFFDWLINDWNPATVTWNTKPASWLFSHNIIDRSAILGQEIFRLESAAASEILGTHIPYTNDDARTLSIYFDEVGPGPLNTAMPTVYASTVQAGTPTNTQFILPAGAVASDPANADGTFVGGYVRFETGVNSGIESRVTEYDGTSHTITVEEFSQPPAVGDRFRIYAPVYGLLLLAMARDDSYSECSLSFSEVEVYQ